jgi:excisionase family DNA binding protein
VTTPPETCLSVDAAAEYLGVQPLTVRRLIARKRLKAFRVGRRVLITRDAIARFQEDNPA